MKPAPLLALIASLCGAIASPGSLPAQEAGDVATLDVLPGWRDVDGSHFAALRIRLAPGWKTYWRAPGDTGIPARFDWSGSRNLANVSVHWPVPDLFSLNGLTSIGYADQVVIPLELAAVDPNRPIDLSGRVEFGVCESICVPVTAVLSADLSAAPVRKDARIRAALADRPMTRTEARVGAVRCDMAPARNGVSVTATIPMPPLGGEEFAVLELPGAPVWVSETETRRSGDTLTVDADLVATGGGGGLALDRSRLRITVIGTHGAVDIQGCG